MLNSQRAAGPTKAPVQVQTKASDDFFLKAKGPEVKQGIKDPDADDDDEDLAGGFVMPDMAHMQRRKMTRMPTTTLFEESDEDSDD